MRMIMLGNVMYMDMGADQAAQMDGKRWMKLDMQAAAAASGDQALSKSMTGGLENMNQDPAKQLALLLELAATSSTSVPRRSTAPRPSTTRAR